MTAAPQPASPVEPPPWGETPSPPPPPGPPARPPLRRSTDKMIGGVCGGLAEYSGIDPLLWRVGFVALTFAGGSGILVYLLLWLLMPSAPLGPGGAEAPRRRPGRPRSTEPRSPVPRVTVAVLLIVTGILALIDRFSPWDVGPQGFLGSALLVVGLGLVAAAFVGGRRGRGGLIAMGVVLALALVASSAAPHWRHPDMGDRVFQPATASAVLPVYHGGMGDMTVDLTGVDLSAVHQPIPTRIEHTVGDVSVRVPESADVTVSVDSGVGSVDLFAGTAETNGIYPGTGSASWTDDGRPEFVITISSSMGDVEVSRG